MSKTVVGRNDANGLTIETVEDSGIVNPNTGVVAIQVGFTPITELPGSTNLQEALQALATGAGSTGVSPVDLASHAHNKGASMVGLEDVGGLITATQVEAALAEIVGNVNTNTSNIATNTSSISSNATAIALRPLTTDLASVVHNKGASTIGVEDAGALLTSTDVEAALAEIVTKANTAGTNATTALTPFSLADKFKARFKALNPALYSIVQFDELEIQGNGEEPTDTQWRLMNGTVRTTDHLTVVKCDGNGNMGIVAVGRPGTSPIHPRTGKWHMGGAAYFNNQAVGVDDWRGFTLAGAALDYHDMLGMGIFNDVSSTKFGWLLKVSNVVTQAVPSTVNAGTAGWHIFEVWSDGSSIFGSVDFETPILITAAIGTDAPNGNLSQIHGAISGTNTIYPDAVGTCSERI